MAAASKCRTGTLVASLLPRGVVLSEVLRCTYGQYLACMMASCIGVHHSPLCPVVVSGKKSGYSSKEGAMMDDSRSSGQHSTDVAVGNEDH